ncbi:hypothetical protein BV20DRAFT_963755 [Pilatotrama ljubarskyi]|nr:hypothetical protein BV20DRAFT_963755 [Pilatotrama ljubarskyi]
MGTNRGQAHFWPHCLLYALFLIASLFSLQSHEVTAGLEPAAHLLLDPDFLDANRRGAMTWGRSRRFADSSLAFVVVSRP